jgi:glycosyltransferase involved in cell wall biosynthesis
VAEPAGADPRYPKVSVIVPTCDRPGLLERAVRHVLDQDYPGDLECVVVYDHVPVRPLEVATSPGRELILVANTRPQGLPGGRNTGAAVAGGRLLAFCDDDDVWYREKLSRQVAVLNEQPDVGAVACGIRLLGPGIDHERTLDADRVTLDDLLADRTMVVNQSTIVFRRSVWEAAGPVDEDIPGGYAEDYEWLLRLAAVQPIAVIRDPLTIIEWHGNSFFFGRWLTIVDALRYLLAKHPEFARARLGRARIHGQIAFALAAAGRRREAWVELARVARLHPGEKRLYATLPVVLGLMSGDRVLGMAQRRGRGV